MGKSLHMHALPRTPLANVLLGRGYRFLQGVSAAARDPAVCRQHFTGVLLVPLETLVHVTVQNRVVAIHGTIDVYAEWYQRF